MPQTLLRREGDQTINRFGLGEQPRIFQPAGNAEELVPMFIGNADGDRDRDDSAENSGPIRDQEALVRLRENDEFVAG